MLVIRVIILTILVLLSKVVFAEKRIVKHLKCIGNYTETKREYKISPCPTSKNFSNFESETGTIISYGKLTYYNSKISDFKLNHPEIQYYGGLLSHLNCKTVKATSDYPEKYICNGESNFWGNHFERKDIGSFNYTPSFNRFEFINEMSVLLNRCEENKDLHLFFPYLYQRIELFCEPLVEKEKNKFEIFNFFK